MNATAIICCWSCKKTNVTLKRIRDEFGLKTEDYVCLSCEPLSPKPTHPNISFIPIPKKGGELQKTL